MSGTQIAFLALLVGAGQLMFAALFFFGIDYNSFKWGRKKRGLADITLAPRRTMRRPTLVVLLILFGFVFVGYGFYRTFDRPVSSRAQEQEIGRLRATVKKFEDRADEEAKREWPPLSEQQIKDWAAVLGPQRGKLKAIIVFWSQDVDAKKLFWSLQAVGKLIGVSVQSWGTAGIEGEKIEILDHPNGLGKSVADLFTKAGHPVVLHETGSGYGDDHLSIYIPQRSTQP